MTENQGTTDFATNFDVNAFFQWPFHCAKTCICSMGSFKDCPTVNLLDFQHQLISNTYERGTLYTNTNPFKL